MNSIDITSVGRDRATDVAMLIATAFADLEVANWLVADRRERIRALAGQFAMLVEHACSHGHVHTADDPDGHTVAAAVWFDYTKHVPEPPGYDERLPGITGEHLPRFQALDEAMAAHHPQEPHHHLAFIATLPTHQGRGLGTALMNHHHPTLDRTGVAAYLEASNLRTRDLYIHHGYKVQSKTLALPEGGPVMWPMWRPPGG
ncbi:MAG TPA: GNAT family N-acetyltransferase [Candidatus Stackebrandtia excrementipullorum]|nr:GNAT family N-acetyltransferase [Candidatus Stackebrandtia excrementipullorum]